MPQVESRGFPKSLGNYNGIAHCIFDIRSFDLVADCTNAFLKDLPELKAKLQPALGNLQHWLENNFNISIAAQDEWQNESNQLSGNTPGLISRLFSQTVSGLFTLFITPVFAALCITVKTLFSSLKKFLVKDTSTGYTRCSTNHHHLFPFHQRDGIVYLIVGVLNSVGLRQHWAYGSYPF